MACMSMCHNPKSLLKEETTLSPPGQEFPGQELCLLLHLHTSEGYGILWGHLERMYPSWEVSRRQRTMGALYSTVTQQNPAVAAPGSEAASDALPVAPAHNQSLSSLPHPGI